MNVGRGYVIHNSESVSDEGGYRAARAAKKGCKKQCILKPEKVSEQMGVSSMAKSLVLPQNSPAFPLT